MEPPPRYVGSSTRLPLVGPGECPVVVVFSQIGAALGRSAHLKLYSGLSPQSATLSLVSRHPPHR
eukprot:1475725-Heterocapsa_arctica.AAC.1